MNATAWKRWTVSATRERYVGGGPRGSLTRRRMFLLAPGGLGSARGGPGDALGSSPLPLETALVRAGQERTAPVSGGRHRPGSATRGALERDLRREDELAEA